MSNAYKELKERHQKEFNAFPIGFAFGEQQFIKQMKEFGLEPTDKDKVCGVGGGGFIRKSDKQAYIDMLDRHELEMKQAIEDTVNGEQFIFDMFNYELGNHEYCVTYSLTDTLNALGYTFDEVQSDVRLLTGLNKAMKSQKDFHKMFG